MEADPVAALLKGAWRMARWAFSYRARVREWRRAAAACGLTNVREVRRLALTHRVDAESGPLRVTFTSSPPREDESPRGTIVVAGLAQGLTGPVERGQLGGFDVPMGMAEVPPVSGPQLLLCALLDPEARRLLSTLFTGHVEGEDGVERRWECRTRLGAGRLTIDYEGELSDEAVRGALRAARRLVAPEGAAVRAAENLVRETSPYLRLHILRTLIAEAPGHPATVAAVQAALADDADAMRLEAALAAGEEGRAVLRALASPDTTEAALAGAITALGAELPAAELHALLADAVARRRTRAAIACVEQLGTRGPEETDALVGVLRCADPGVVLAAAQALTWHGNTREAVIALREAAEIARNDRDLADAVRQAVLAIQLRLEKAGAGQLSVAGGEAGTVSLADDPQGRVTLDRVDEPAQS